MSANIHPQVLLATARVQAALLILPRIVGPRQAWVPWLRNGLLIELERIPHPSPTSPHPRLLGSLRRVLLDYYSSGMNGDFDLSSVRDSDDLVTEEEYTDISDSLDPLPDLTGDLWWQELPPSVSLRAPQSPRLSDTSSIPKDTSGSEQESKLASIVAELQERVEALEERDATAQRERKTMMTMIINLQTELRNNSSTPKGTSASKHRSGDGDSLASIVAELRERAYALEERVAAHERGDRELMIRVATMEIEISKLKKDAERSSRLNRSSLPTHHRAGRRRRC